MTNYRSYLQKGLIGGLCACLLAGCTSQNSTAVSQEEPAVTEQESIANEEVELIDPVQFNKVFYNETGTYQTSVDQDLPADQQDEDLRVYLLKDDEQLECTIESIEKADGKVTIVFDSADPEYRNQNFLVQYETDEEQDREPFLGIIPVEYYTYSLSSDPESIPSDASDFIVTIDVDSEGSLKEDLSKEDITLDGSFKNLEIAELSNGSKALTLSLKGGLVMDQQAGIYQDGIIEISASAMESAEKNASLSVPVVLAGASFVLSEITMDGNTLVIPVASAAFESREDELSCSISEPWNIEKAENRDGTVYLSIPTEARTLDGAVQALDGAEIIINDESLHFEASFAGFYPVLDYAEDSDQGLDLTLLLYPQSGTFNEISSDSFTFETDSPAVVESADLQDDGSVLMIVELQDTDLDAEDFSVDAILKAASGSLENLWGTTLEQESSYTRTYSDETIGKAASNTAISDTALIMNEAGGIIFDALPSVIGEIGGPFAESGVSKLLSYAGIVTSPDDQVLEQLEKVLTSLNEIKSQLASQLSLLQQIETEQKESFVNSYVTDLFNLEQDVAQVQGYYKKAAKDNNLDNATDEQLAQALSTLTEYIIGQENAKADAYVNFSSWMLSLQRDLNSLCNDLFGKSKNPLAVFNQLCAQKYNFGTQCDAIRLSLITRSEYALSEGITLLITRYHDSQNQYSQSYTNYQQAYPLVSQFEFTPQSDRTTFYTAPGQPQVSLSLANNPFDSYPETGYLTYNNVISLGSNEVSNFVSRMSQKTLELELKEAGFDTSAANGTKGVFMNITSESNTGDQYRPKMSGLYPTVSSSYNYNVKGSYMALNANSLTSTQLGQYHSAGQGVFVIGFQGTTKTIDPGWNSSTPLGYFKKA